MQSIDWRRLIDGLIRSGMTQTQLAAAVGCGQSTINDLLKGRTNEPRASVTLALIGLANTRCGAGIRLDQFVPSVPAAPHVPTDGAPPVPAEQQEVRDAA